MSAAFGIRLRGAAVLGNRMYRLLFLATLGSGFGTWMATIALTADVDARSNSTWWVSALFFVTFVPSVAVGLLIGPLIDRLSRRRLIVASDLARLGVFVALPFAHRLPTMIALAAVNGVANSFFRPAVLAGVPNLVERKDLDAATSLLQGTDWFAAAIGPVVGGALVALSGAHLVYWINAATFLFSALLLVRIPSRLLQSEQGITRGHWHDLREGVGAFRRSTALKVALFGFGFTMLASGLVNVSEIFLAKNTLHSGTFGFGLLWSATGVGLVAGSLALGPLLGGRNVLDLYPLAFIPLAVGIFGAAVAPWVWLAAAAMVLTGFGNGVAFPMTVLIIQRHTSDAVRGRAFTVVISFHIALLGLAQVASGALTAALGARWTYGIAGCCALASAVTVVTMLRGLPSRAALPSQAPA